MKKFDEFSYFWYRLCVPVFLSLGLLNVLFLFFDKTMKYSVIVERPSCLLSIVVALPLFYFLSKSFVGKMPERLRRHLVFATCFLLISLALFILASFKNFPSDGKVYGNGIDQSVIAGKWYCFPPSNEILFFPD